MEALSTGSLATPLGRMYITADGVGLRRIAFVRPAWQAEETPLIRQAKAALAAYFAGEKPVLALPLTITGTPFQRQVWQALAGVPYGQTVTYGELAAQVGRPAAARAVGQAVHVNPLLILVPCHRVVAANGPGGFVAGLARKQWLLAWEQAHCQ